MGDQDDEHETSWYRPSLRVLDPKEATLMAVSCDTFEYGRKVDGNFTLFGGACVTFELPILVLPSLFYATLLYVGTKERCQKETGDAMISTRPQKEWNASLDPIRRSKDTNNDRITVEWCNTPEGAAKQFRREWFQGDGMVRRKNLPIEYNP
ncbi:hypothetical protein KIN20_015463 [Parelaphostrongylus tenuis]|uniref:Uncharacterized protein n=1 Tax=Parelaphostrongylus tenuis TaxID=148309 RepID=A0AAD5MEX9_PARTN|nr:hypothetical protein KIN20_015463 [Parelaphostrongylus tenuis]